MSERSSRVARFRLAVVLVFIAALAGAAGGCGRKGNLEPPPSAGTDQSERDEDR